MQNKEIQQIRFGGSASWGKKTILSFPRLIYNQKVVPLQREGATAERGGSGEQRSLAVYRLGSWGRFV